MRIEFDSLDDHEIVDEHDPLETLIHFEELEDADLWKPADPRLQKLSGRTRELITHLFGGDVDDAVYAACRLINTRRAVPEWALELKSLCNR
jgi:hypothetical protein